MRLPAISLMRAFALLLALGSVAPAWALNVIQIENAKAGTTEWLLTSPRQNNEIEGYASATSINRGQSIKLYVKNLVSASYTIDVYRLGWYGGAGARKVLGPIVKSSVVQPASTTDANGLVECNWVDPFVLTVPRNAADASDWASGVYLAKLTANNSGPQSYIIFTVRDDDRLPGATYLFQSSVNTWQAYNIWGGQSLYAFNSRGNVPARKVSFNRPYDRNNGTGDFLGDVTGGWEINMLRFLEKEGYDVSYATNVDLHVAGLSLLRRHRAFLSVGHDEYWSYAMKKAAQNARDTGTNLGFFGANAVYWQVRYEPGVAVPTPNRTLVGYKDAAQTSDPFWLDGNPNDNKYITTRFRDLVVPPYNVRDSVAQPENGLIGVMYHGDPVCCNMLVSDATSWVFANTGVANGMLLPNMLGYETDSKFDNGFQPKGLSTIATSPDQFGYSHATTYTAQSGAAVFATGSMQWNWGLDDFNVPRSRSSSLNPIVMHATRNVLARFSILGVAAPMLTSIGRTATSLTLSWHQSSSPATVLNRVYRSGGPDGPFTTVATIPASTSYTDHTVATGISYYYTVSAINGEGLESAPSDALSGTPR